jgi:site-specific DNA recombinase
MEKLDNLVADTADRLLQPERLEEILASVLDRRQERAERRREHTAELNKRAAETDLRLKRLYDAIEAGIAGLDDPALKERIASLKAIRDQAQVEAARAAAMLESPAQQSITPDGPEVRGRHASGSGSMTAATAATISARSPKGRGRRSRGPRYRL